MPKAKEVKDALQVAALPWRARRGSLEFLLVTSRASRHWLIPKGWPMLGKSNREAALQEAFEEAGVSGVGSVGPIGSYRFLKAMHDGTELPCVMSVYGMSDVVELDAWPEMEQRERLWVPQIDALDMIFDWSLARFLADLTLDRSKRLVTGAGIASRPSIVP
jgi:8-oxo-dGTP pyrophosphatase MutT (NUDIX family)